MKPVHSLYASAFVLGSMSLLVPKVALFSVLLSVIALAAWTREVGAHRKRLLSALVFSSVLASAGTIRFVLVEAMPGIIEARGRDSSAKAVSLLREILFAENAARRNAMIDPDGDGIGSAGLLGELTGAVPARGRSVLPVPPLSPRLAPRVATRSGPATENDGYLFLVCVPTKGGALSAEPSSTFDDEAAERRFVAYAWPATDSGPASSVFQLDEHEGILEDPNRTEGGLRLVGPARSPACDDALAPPTRERYVPWRGKKPRESLPGDRP